MGFLLFDDGQEILDLWKTYSIRMVRKNKTGELNTDRIA